MIIPHFTLKDGANVFRIITSPYQFPREAGETPLWACGIFSRWDKEVYILEMDYEIFRQVRTYALHPAWGDPKRYDIDLNVRDGRITLVPHPDIDDTIIPHPETPKVQQYLDDKVKMFLTFG